MFCDRHAFHTGFARGVAERVRDAGRIGFGSRHGSVEIDHEQSQMGIERLGQIDCVG